MKKLSIMLMTGLMAFSLLTGCGSKKETEVQEPEVKTIVDCSGTEVELPTSLEKIVVTSPSAVSFMTAMNLEDKLVGTHGAILNHTWSSVFSEKFNDMALYGKNPNPEELIAADVDLVILKDAEYAEELRKSGINAVCFKYRNKDELYSAVDMLGEIFGDDAKAYAAAWEEKFDSTVEGIASDLAELPESEKKNVYYVDATGAEATNESLYLTAGGGSFVEYWVNSSGANLVTSPYEDIEQIDQETALSLNPDTVFICGWLEYTAKDVIMNDPLWQDVPAIKDDSVFLMPTSFVSYDRFAVELPLMLDYTANLLYPDLHEFGGIEELKEFYKDYYGRSFDDDQLENMLLGLNPDGTQMGEIREP